METKLTSSPLSFATQFDNVSVGDYAECFCFEFPVYGLQQNNK